MIHYGTSKNKNFSDYLAENYSRLFSTLDKTEIITLKSLDERSNTFISKNDCAYLDSRFSISSLMFACEILLGESILSGDIEKGLVFKVFAALLCVHASRSLGACNADIDYHPYGIPRENNKKYNDAHLINVISQRSSQFLKESFIRFPSYEQQEFQTELNKKISDGIISNHLFTDMDEVFNEISIFSLVKPKTLAVEIINASMSLSILCRPGLTHCLPLLFFDFECAKITKINDILDCKQLEKFIFEYFWSGAYFSVVRGIRNLEYASDAGSMVVGSLYSNLLSYEGKT